MVDSEPEPTSDMDETVVEEAPPVAAALPSVRIVQASFDGPVRHPQSLRRPNEEGRVERLSLSGTAGPLLPPLLRYLDVAWDQLGRHLWGAMGDALAALWIPLLLPLAAGLGLLLPAPGRRTSGSRCPSSRGC